MIAVVLPGAAGALAFLFWLWAIFDLISTDSMLVRNRPKTTWLFVVLLLPVIGAMAWLALGRPEDAGLSLGGHRRLPYEYNPERTARSRVTGLEDSMDWSAGSEPSLPSSMRNDDPVAIRERKLLEKQAELAKREAQREQPVESDDEAGLGDDEEHG